MAGRKSLIIFCDRLKELEMLSDEQAGRLFRALIKYASTGEVLQENEEIAVKLIFSVMKSAIDENNEKFEKRCEKNRQIAKEREEKRRAEREQYSTNVNERERTCTKSTETETETETETDIIINNNNTSYCESVGAHARIKKFGKPSLDEVRAYCKERSSQVNPERFYSYYESNGWKVGKNQMKDWKAAVRNWETNGYKNDTAQEPDPQLEEYKKVINKFLY